MKPIVVIKLGGASLQNPNTLNELIGLIQNYQNRFSIVVVHGGGPAINQALVNRGIEWKFINGQRQTTPEMMNVINEVLSIQVNVQIVNTFKSADLNAIGMSGAKDRILICKHSLPELMQVGSITQVNTEKIIEALSHVPAKIPVIAPIGVSETGDKFNINADWAATQIAIALKAEKLMFLTDQDGILDRNKNLVQSAFPNDINQMIQSGVISGGMQTKVLAMISAIEAGVNHVHVLNAGKASQLLQKDHVGTLLENPNQIGVSREHNI